MGVDTSLQYNGYNSYKFNQNDFLICYPFGVENMEHITHSFGAYSPIALDAKVRAYTRFFNADGEEIKLENHSFAVQQGTFDKVEITVSVPALAVKAELKFLNNETQPWWVATPKTEEGQNATPYAINAYGQLTYITPNGIYTGTITANQIVLASGGSLPDRLTKINANGVYTGEVVAEQMTTGVLQGGKVVFDLNNGTLLIGNDVSNYQLYFDGNDIKIKGEIISTSGAIGGFTLDDTGFSKTSSETFGPFTTADVTTIQQIILSGNPPTQAQLNRYDINRDGILNASDMMSVKRMALGEDSHTRNNTIRINSDNPNILIRAYSSDSVSGELRGETTVGTNSITTSSIVATEIKVDDIDIWFGATGVFESKDGKTIFVEKGVITAIA